MSSIRVLPEELSNRIAAGEVVERPASVVKELLENGVDAHAGRISVRTEKGGRNLVQVTDDGKGMDTEDAMLAVQAHATSKVAEPADLEQIRTLGFRGEALASISAVSRFKLQTRTAEAVSGTEVTVDGGNIRNITECGCSPGTSVSVGRLFYNMPARRKFLRTAATEDGHIHETVLMHALANCGVAFQLQADDRTVLNVTRTADNGARVAMLLGKDVFEYMLPVEYREEEVEVTGFVARPGMTRATRRDQRIIVNGRPADVRPIYYAIREAYQTLVMKGRYPAVVLYISLPCDQVDVNVHPAKREVRFRNERHVSRIVEAAIRRALRRLAGAHVGPETDSGVESPQEESPAKSVGTAPSGQTPEFNLERENQQITWAPPPAGEEDADHPSSVKTGVSRTGNSPEVVPAAGEQHGGADLNSENGTADSTDLDIQNEIKNLNILGTLSNLYLLAEGSAGLVLIDQHAAHERVVFEKLLAAVRSGAASQQSLLMPETVELTPADAALLKQYMDTFQQLGFAIEEFGGCTYLVTAVPPQFTPADLQQTVPYMLDELRENPGGARPSDDVRVAQAACRHAVKAEDALHARELDRLMKDLANTELPFTCPHGRPVMINIPHQEIEKRFGRRT